MNLRIDNRAAELCRIDIEGTIGVPENCQFDDPADRVATYDRFREAVARIAAVEAPEVLVTIRSTGGDVNDALLIHDALRRLDARITTRCHGYTASAATVIAQAASAGCRELSVNALYLIHRASCAAEGNAAELGARIDLLHATDERLAALYAARAGRPAAHFAALMAENNGNGRWLSPEEAVEAGLADRIVDLGEAAQPDPQNAPQPDPQTEPRPAATHAPAVRSGSGTDGGPEKNGNGGGHGDSGWRRLLRAVGLAPEAPDSAATAAPALEVFRFDDAPHALSLLQQPLPHPAPAAATHPLTRTLDEIGPTRTLPTEDPRHGTLRRSANERAYAEDARRFARR